MPIWLPKKFERPMSFKPRVKPAGVVKVDEGHPLSQTIKGCFLLQNSLHNLMGRDALTNVNGSYSHAGLNIDTSGEYLRLDAVELLRDNDSYTLTLIYVNESPKGSYPRLWEINGASSGVFYRNNSNTSARINGANYNVENIWNGEVHVITYAVKNVNNSATNTVNPPSRYAFINGRKIQDVTERFDSLSLSASNWIRIGNRADGARPCEGSIKAIYLHDDKLPDVLIRQLHQNPYQFLVPK